MQEVYLVFFHGALPKLIQRNLTQTSAYRVDEDDSEKERGRERGGGEREGKKANDREVDLHTTAATMS